MNSHHSRKDGLECQGTSNVLRKLLKRAGSYEDDMIPFSGATIITKLLKSNKAREPEPSQDDSCSNSSQECLSPFGQTARTHSDSERINEDHLQAKRARVENIIRGMNHSPMAKEEDGETPALSFSPRDRENKRKQKLPQQQTLVSTRKAQKVEERRQLKVQLEDLQKQLRQLQEKFFQVYDSTDSEADGGNLSEDGAVLGVEDEARILEDEVLLDGEIRDQGSKALVSMHKVGKHLAETLKQELNTAMSKVVDTVVNVLSKPQRPLLFPATHDRFAFNGDNPNFHTSNQKLQCFGDVIFPSPFDSFVGVSLPSANDQMEALPLVVQKSASEHHQSAVGAQSGHPPSNTGFISPSFRHPFSLPLMGYSFQSTLGASSTGYPRKDSPDLMDLSRETTSFRKKMTSSLMHNRSCSTLYPESTAEGLSLIKSECGDLQDMSDISPLSGSTISFS